MWVRQSFLFYWKQDMWLSFTCSLELACLHLAFSFYWSVCYCIVSLDQFNILPECLMCLISCPRFSTVSNFLLVRDVFPTSLIHELFKPRVLEILLRQVFEGNQTLIMSACMLGNIILCDFLFSAGKNR